MSNCLTLWNESLSLSLTQFPINFLLDSLELMFWTGKEWAKAGSKEFLWNFSLIFIESNIWHFNQNRLLRLEVVLHSQSKLDLFHNHRKVWQTHPAAIEEKNQSKRAIFFGGHGRRRSNVKLIFNARKHFSNAVINAANGRLLLASQRKLHLLINSSNLDCRG